MGRIYELDDAIIEALDLVEGEFEPMTIEEMEQLDRDDEGNES